MQFFSKLLGKNKTKVEIVSRRPVGKFKVEKVFEIVRRQVLIGEVVEGIIYPGYKLKGDNIAIIREIQRDRQKVDFAVEYDKVALVLEGRVNTIKGEILEIYQS